MTTVPSVEKDSNKVTSSEHADHRLFGLIAFLVAAILTPPDLISQIGLGIPIVILFEISIVLSKFFERKKEESINKKRTKKNIGETDFNE